ncbi:MAG: Holliday junction resolvase RuvX [Bacillota bacterium]|nr:MAG: Holliday junction resolvase RuvX [Bacillota bacterium]
MKKILALDIGSKRIGVAVTDPFGTYALPVGTYVRKNLKTDLAYIADLAKERGAEEIVCGLPLNFDGSRSAQTEYTEVFINALKGAVSAPVFTSDERCTTAEAHSTLIAGNKRREERKKYVDALAATYILEGYLRNNKIKGEEK